MTFDLTKPARTRDGKPARIIATDVKNADQPIVALVVAGSPGDEYEEIETFSEDGSYLPGATGPHPKDLVNAPEQTVRFHNVYGDRIGRAHSDLVSAGILKSQGTLKLTYENDKLVAAEVVR